MASLKFKDIKKMPEQEKVKKLKELKLELIKSRLSSSKKGSANSKQIRKMIARILTSNKQHEKQKK